MDRKRKAKTEEFKNPGTKYRSKPFWAWNGKLEEKELYRQLDIIKDMGFGGAFLHSRVGLETEYMGNEWMELIAKCLKYGKEKELEIWLYDEDRWPSGTAGGRVTKKKENRSRRLQLTVLEPASASAYITKEKEKLAGLYSCCLDGHEYQELCQLDLKEYKEADHIGIPGEKILAVTIEESELSDNYNGYTYLDTMKESAVEDYLTATHDKYERELPKDALSYIKGIFTDEPHRGAFLCDFSEGNQKSIPYTEDLFEGFQKKYGYDLRRELPNIFFREKGKPFSKAAFDYVEFAQELFLENYMKKYEERCHKYGWVFTGHLLHEDSLSSQTCMLGSLMSGYEYMDIPGIDLLGEHTSCWWIGKQLSSVAHQLNKKEMLTELFGCTGWQMSFQNYKEIGDWQAMMGINLFCPHLSWYTMAGENKRDYPASIFFQSAWYKQYKYVEDYFARIHMCTEGEPADCRLLVLNPVGSVWARAYSGGFQWLEANDPGILAVEKQYQETFQILMEAGIDFDYGEERILSRYGSVKDGTLQVGSCTYQKVLLSAVETVKESTWELLDKFVKQGGQLIIAGKVPERIHTQLDRRMEQLAEMAVKIPFEKEKIKEACKPQNPLYILENHGNRVFVQGYAREGCITFILLNMDRINKAEQIELTVEKGILEQADVRTGERFPVETEIISDFDESLQQKITFHLAQGEERIYILHTAGDSSFFAEKVTRETGEKKDTSNSNKSAEVLRQEFFSYQLSEPNTAVLDRADIYVEGQPILYQEEVLKADRKLRDSLGYPWRGGEMMQPWYTAKYHKDQLQKRHKVQAVYQFWADTIPDTMTIAAEIQEGQTSLQINGHLLEPTGDFWLDKAFWKFQVDPDKLYEGKNTITVEHEYGKDSGLEAIYLLGNFGVALKKREGQETVHLDVLPEKLRAGNITDQGFPFYSGTITYELFQKMEGKIQVILEEMPAAFAILHGDTDEIVAFAPYEAQVRDLSSIEMIFNRRNTFGPLHLPLSYRGNYGPETFLTEKELWKNEMQLYPQGLPQNITFLREK